MKRSEMMERAKFVKHGGKMVFHLNFGGLAVDDAREVAEYGKAVIAKMPARSVLTLTNVTDAVYDGGFNAVAKDLVAANKPHVLAGAVVGVTGWRKVAYLAALAFSGRDNLKLFDGTDEALAWLAGYRGA